MNKFERVKKEARKFFTNAHSSHDWSHVERVYKLCLHIGKKEGANFEILKLAAVLHDISREHEDKVGGKICHAEEGAKGARKILEKYNFSKETIEKVIHSIEYHRFRGNRIPQSKEAKILFDADKLDSIGAVGIGRAFLFAGRTGAKLHNKEVDVNKTKPYTKEDTAYREFLVKLKFLKDRMLTKEGKRLAKERHNFMVEFFNRLNKEIKGNL